MSETFKTYEVMPIEVFVGGCGHIVLLQELPSLVDGERYIRVMLNERDAERVAMAILTRAEEARR